ncbi:AraC family transcriptional regulator [Leptospira langatensis]|uniref:AraC family transcriptional regulator n=1 Tax=Leptospira langatensis TaxID=2484983 RepID=A0A5F1ZZH2_9LEPT|nr:helix-turn-helix domain-containing protein [Leptospira langatensis]TGJ98493.1 AraC family transcriptional regulator [Leptospira langatensis]TGL43407.1 AraC family transcriptional regulator [Leptospira langatensis]
MPNPGLLSQSYDNANPWFLIFWGITQFGAALGILMSLGQLVMEKKTSLNRLLALLFFQMGLLQACFLLLVSGEYREFPRISLAELPLIASTGPILFGIHRVSQDQDSDKNGFLGLSNKHLVLPILVWIVYLAAISILPVSYMVDKITLFMTQTGWNEGEILLLLPLLNLGFYIWLIIWGSWDLFRWEILQEEWTARILLFMVIATFANMAFGAFFLASKSPLSLLGCSAMMGLSLCLAYLIGHKRPAFFQTLQEVSEAARQKYTRSLLLGVDRNALRENLKQLMERDKLYRDEELSLADLADELALSTHQVSELINQELGINFSAFVNDYRIKEACELLQKEPDRSVLDIAFAVGFATKSSFHRAFQKHTGKTPSQFRGSEPV